MNRRAKNRTFQLFLSRFLNTSGADSTRLWRCHQRLFCRHVKARTPHGKVLPPADVQRREKYGQSPGDLWFLVQRIENLLQPPLLFLYLWATHQLLSFLLELPLLLLQFWTRLDRLHFLLHLLAAPLYLQAGFDLLEPLLGLFLPGLKVQIGLLNLELRPSSQQNV